MSVLALAVASGALLGGCGPSDLTGGIPIPQDAGATEDADASAVDDAGDDAAIDGSGGTPCTMDAQCDDQIACTTDACDMLAGQCTHVADDTKCDDMRFCDGTESCDVMHGCIAGSPITCSDNDVCTIDSCVESDHSCMHSPRDVDGDGDPDDHCPGGGDCNDQNPAISSLHDEVCANGIDDNCNGQVDEIPCDAPAYSTCAKPLVVMAPGSYQLSTIGAAQTLAASCGPVMEMTARNVVAALVVPDGPPQRLDAKVTVAAGTAAVAIDGQCGVASSEMTCAVSEPDPSGLQTVRARVWSLAPGTYPIIILTDADTVATLEVTLSAAGVAPTNETCGTAIPILPNQSVLVPLVGARADIPTSCNGTSADLVYRVDLATAQDVRVFASSEDGLATTTISIRDASCAMLPDELICRSGDPLDVLARKQGPGSIYVVVEASTEDDVNLLVTLEPPTDPPADETCVGSPELTPNQDLEINLVDHTTDVKLCGTNLLDAAYALDLTQSSDVLAVMHRPSSSGAALSIDLPACAAMTDVIECASNAPYPIRVAAPALAAGSYRVVAGMSLGDPAELTAFVRPAVPSVAVVGADTCDVAIVIPETGGYFTGDTTTVNPDYSSGCDEGGVPGNGAPDQMLRLDLTAKRRVILDMEGSQYQTLLDVRQGPDCPGMEVPNACTIGVDTGHGYLDVVLDVGTYWVQVDGFDGQAGVWSLAVFTVPSP